MVTDDGADFGHEAFVHRFADILQVALDGLGTGGAEDRGGDAGIAARELHGQLLDGIAFLLAVSGCTSACLLQFLGSRMPIGSATLGEQSHCQRRGVDDTNTVHLEKSEIVFEGIVIAKKHGGIEETITVRRLAYGVGVEKVFPIHSPSIEKIETVRKGYVRRAAGRRIVLNLKKK